MKRFETELRERAPDPVGRRWLFVAEDQLSSEIGPLSREDPRDLGIVLVENRWKMARRPYHRQRLALLIATARHFALEQAARGVAVRYVVAGAPFRRVLAPLAEELGPLRVMRPAERELRADLEPLVRGGALEEIPHEGWLTTTEQFLTGAGGEPPWRMDAFYRHVRRQTGLLMEGGKPSGGKLSFDTDNRKRWPGDPPAAVPPSFPIDPIKQEVGATVEAELAQHPGRLDLDALPATAQDAEAAWRWALSDCLPWFGPYQDAMAEASTTLFHTRISPLLNLHRLLPARVVADAAAAEPVPLASREGFVRQVIGWREFVRHVHEQTDGFRRGLRRGLAVDVPVDVPVDVAASPGDGGYRGWMGRDWSRVPAPAPGRGRESDSGAHPGDDPGEEPDGGAMPSHLGAQEALPPAWWGTPSGLRCLDANVAAVWDEAYGHHITRLMVLANLATLLDVSPRELTDWFWVAYADAHDWVVEPNVLGMGTYAVGPLMTTKPYVSGAAYIDRMSDHCKACAFHPKKDCPVTSLYWDFLRRHRERLEDNPRLKMPYRSLAKRSEAQRQRDREIAETAARRLRAGSPLQPGDL